MTGFRTTEVCTPAEAQEVAFTLGRYAGNRCPEPTRAVMNMAKIDARRHVEKCGRYGADRILLWREVDTGRGFDLQLVGEVKP